MYDRHLITIDRADTNHSKATSRYRQWNFELKFNPIRLVFVSYQEKERKTARHKWKTIARYGTNHSAQWTFKNLTKEQVEIPQSVLDDARQVLCEQVQDINVVV